VQLADGRATLAGLRVGVIPELVEVRLLLTLREETPALRALMAGGTGEQWEGGDGED